MNRRRREEKRREEREGKGVECPGGCRSRVKELNSIRSDELS
jgi:hypothetical protein